VFLKVSVWKQGRINMDRLKNYLSSAVKHSNWDLVMEYCLLVAPLGTGSEETLLPSPNPG